MKGVLKGVIIGLVVVCIGVAVLIAGLALNGWKLSPDIEFQTASYTAEGGISALKIDLDAGTVATQFYDGENIVIEYAEAEGFTTKITEADSTLSLSCPTKKWYKFWGWSGKIPQTTVKLPAGKVFDISFDIDAGTAELADGTYGKVVFNVDAGTVKGVNIVCDSLNCDMDAGTVNITSLKCGSFINDLDAGKIEVAYVDCAYCDITVDAGRVSLGFAGEKAYYTITSRVNAGSCNVSPQSGTTDKKIDIDVAAGSVNVTFGN